MNEADLLWRLGQRIKHLRESKKITQESIAFNLDTDRANISRLESGRVNPKFTTLVKMANELDVSINKLIDIEYD
jgi:transcriptional regulator with XRE-family HTH domain